MTYSKEIEGEATDLVNYADSGDVEAFNRICWLLRCEEAIKAYASHFNNVTTEHVVATLLGEKSDGKRTSR